MDPIDAQRKIESLADGIDPITGEVFPPESPYLNAEIVSRCIGLASGVSTSPSSSIGSRSNARVDEENQTREQELQRGRERRRVDGRRCHSAGARDGAAVFSLPCDPDIPSETGSAPPGSAPPGSAAERGGDKGRQEVAAASGLLALGLAIFGLRRRV